MTYMRYKFGLQLPQHTCNTKPKIQCTNKSVEVKTAITIESILPPRPAYI